MNRGREILYVSLIVVLLASLVGYIFWDDERDQEFRKEIMARAVRFSAREVCSNYNARDFVDLALKERIFEDIEKKALKLVMALFSDEKITLPYSNFEADFETEFIAKRIPWGGWGGDISWAGWGAGSSTLSFVNE